MLVIPTKIPFLTEKKIKSFWNRIAITSNADKCWEWLKHTNENGYGRLGIGRKNFYSHRIAYALHNNDYNVTDLVLHKCDNRKCCNPRHLFVGGSIDNVNDAINKGRWKAPFGDKNGKSKLNNEKVKQIRKLYDMKTCTQNELAQRFSVKRSTINDIVYNRTWKHVE